MSYNPRMSMARTVSHNQRAPAANDHDAFITLVRVQLPLNACPWLTATVRL